MILRLTDAEFDWLKTDLERAAGEVDPGRDPGAGVAVDPGADVGPGAGVEADPDLGAGPGARRASREASPDPRAGLSPGQSPGTGPRDQRASPNPDHDPSPNLNPSLEVSHDRPLPATMLKTTKMITTRRWMIRMIKGDCLNNAV